MKAIVCMAVLTMLAGCSSTPSRYYSLAPVVQQTQTQAVTSQTAAPGFAISLAEVRVPGQVDRPQLVVRQDSSAAVTVLNQSLWVAPLADQLKSALAQELTQVLAVPDVSFMAAPAHLPVWTVAVQVHRFELMAGAWTVLDASWTLSRALPSGATPSLDASQSDTPAQICRAVIQMPVTAEGVEPLVDSQRTAVMRLANAIAESISARQAAPDSQVVANQGCTFSFQG